MIQLCTKCLQGQPSNVFARPRVLRSCSQVTGLSSVLASPLGATSSSSLALHSPLYSALSPRHKGTSITDGTLFGSARGKPRLNRRKREHAYKWPGCVCLAGQAGGLEMVGESGNISQMGTSAHHHRPQPCLGSVHVEIHPLTQSDMWVVLKIN